MSASAPSAPAAAAAKRAGPGLAGASREPKKPRAKTPSAAEDADAADVTVRLIPFLERMVDSATGEADRAYYREQSTELGSFGDYRWLQQIRAEVCDAATGQQIGSYQMQLLEKPHPRFLEACDSVDDVLEYVGRTFFGTQGQAEVAEVRDAEEQDSGSSASKPFLYISKWERTDGKENTSYTSARALRALLTETPLAGKWSVVMYIPDGLAAGEEFDRGRPDRRAEMDDATSAARTAVVRAMQRTDAAGFFRAGFRQVIDKRIVEAKNCPFLYATPACLHGHLMCGATARDIPILRPTPERPGPVGVHKELYDHVSKKIGEASAFGPPHHSEQWLQQLRSEIAAWVARGANLASVPLMQAACAVGDFQVLCLLSQMGADPNFVDQHHATALLIAAGQAYNLAGREDAPVLALQCMQLLISTGADKTTTGSDGLSPLGAYWHGKVEAAAFPARLGIENYYSDARQVACERVDHMVVNLLSVAGAVPNKADLACKPPEVPLPELDAEKERLATVAVGLFYAARGGLEAARSKYPGYPTLLIWDKIFARLLQVNRTECEPFKDVLMKQADALAQAPELASAIVEKLWRLKERIE